MPVAPTEALQKTATSTAAATIGTAQMYWDCAAVCGSLYASIRAAGFPHGVFPVSELLCISLMLKVWPGLRVYSIAASSVFSVPVWRHIMAWTGARPATRRWFRKLLQQVGVPTAAFVQSSSAQLFKAAARSWRALFGTLLLLSVWCRCTGGISEMGSVSLVPGGISEMSLWCACYIGIPTETAECAPIVLHVL